MTRHRHFHIQLLHTMKSSTSSQDVTSPSSDSDQAAAAAKEAAMQAKAKAGQAAQALRQLDGPNKIVAGALLVAAICALVFDMVSFEITSSKPVSPTMAAEMTRMEGMLNGAAYSAFSSTLWGKIMMLSAVGGVGLLIWSHLTKQRAGWVPLAIAGSAVLCLAMMLLIGLTGAPSDGLFARNESYLRPDIDLTLLGYWLPLLAAGAAAAAGAKRILPG